ncbi:acyltransferase family protein [Winogradskyella sp.]|uniref:acyltransferase family protein n=2 Tax=Winogradskyella sp. TaxID=1883156 RepID=UPI003510E26F
MKYLPNLDPLRFILASLVIIYHLPQLCRNQGLPYYLDAPIFNRGNEAVYMFFVLSGFLIIRIIYSAKLRHAFSIRNFYIRRVLRIFPLYYLIVAFGFLFYWIVLPFLNIPFENNYNFVEGVSLAIFFLPNVFAELYKPGGILEVLWSIGIEEQFYIIVAPLLFLIRNKWVLAVLMFVTIAYFIVFHIEQFFYLKQFYMVYFFLFFGGIIALLEEKKKLEFLKTRKVVPVLIVVLTLLYFTTTIFLFNSRVLYNLTTTILFGMFIHTVAHNNHGITVRHKFLNYLGQISYGIYMFHVIALNTVVFLFLKLKPYQLFNDLVTIILIYVLTFAITILMAHISYKYFESYFLKLKNKFR